MKNEKRLIKKKKLESFIDNNINYLEETINYYIFKINYSSFVGCIAKSVTSCNGWTDWKNDD